MSQWVTRENQPRRNEGREDTFCSSFVSFVSSWLVFRGVIHVAVSDAGETMKINHDESKGAKIHSVLPSCPSSLRG